MCTIQYDPALALDSPHNLRWAASRGYTYDERDRMYRDKNGRLVEQGTHEASLASFALCAGRGTFW